jgi:hypothetical protein
MIGRASVAVGLVLMLFGAHAATAGATKRAVTAQVNQPIRACGSLGGLDLAGVNARVESAAETTTNGVAFCQVKGYISPQTHFTVLLPQQTWRGSYLQQGCGGFCGYDSVSLTDPARSSGHQGPFGPLSSGELVVAADDQGHAGSGALWAKEDPLLRVVFGYRSEHDLAVTAKAIIAGFYGRAPAYSYFNGVSDGGREALALAQRYPRDFLGILAGAPANNWAALVGVYESWLIRANMDAQGRQILDASKLPALHAAVMRACANAQGVIEDPRSCTFDPAAISCPAGGDRPDCLTTAQVNVVRALYRGPTARGVQLFNGGEPYGSEISWQGWMITAANDPGYPGTTIAGGLALDYLRYMAYWRNPPSSFGLQDVEFSIDSYNRLQPMGDIYDATDPDLRAFRARGGKLILYHGWADQAISPWSTLDYYAAVADEMGGYNATQQFSRLYMVPGLYHCPCGPYPPGDPATSIDLMDDLVDWVQTGNAPGTVTFPVSSQTTGSPLTSLTVKPFNPLLPAPRNDGLNSNYRYIGRESEYRPGRELWCEQREVTLTCSRGRDGHESRAQTAGKVFRNSRPNLL